MEKLFELTNDKTRQAEKMNNESFLCLLLRRDLSETMLLALATYYNETKET